MEQLIRDVCYHATSNERKIFGEIDSSESEMRVRMSRCDNTKFLFYEHKHTFVHHTWGLHKVNMYGALMFIFCKNSQQATGLGFYLSIAVRRKLYSY